MNLLTEIDAESAQRKVTGWLVSDVGNLLIGDTPTLVIADRAVWRVPILLTSPSRGVIGIVGSVDVDAQTGKVLADEALGRRILKDAHLVARSAPTPGKWTTAW